MKVEIKRVLQAKIENFEKWHDFISINLHWLCKQVYDEIRKIKEENNLTQVQHNEEWLTSPNIPFLRGYYNICEYPIKWTAARQFADWDYTHKIIAEFEGEGK